MEDGQASAGSDNTAYGCCGQALTRFTGRPSNGPGRLPAPPLDRGSILAADPDAVHSATLDVMTDASRSDEHAGSSPERADQPARESLFEPPSVRAAREQQSQRMLMRTVRGLFLALLIAVSVMTVASNAQQPEEFDLLTMFGLILAATAVGVIVLIIDSVISNKRLSAVVGVYLGICAGLLVAIAIGALIDVIADAWGLSGGRVETWLGLIKVIIAIVLCYLSVSVVLTTKDDFRLVIPYVEFSKQVRGIRPLVLDTSALIDGRIEGLGNAGFVDAPLIVPQFVIDELQQLSDSGDKLKRERGRRGLNIVGRLQSNPYLDVSIDDPGMTGHSVDHLLVEMARQQHLRILTTDYNLNKVAQIHGVTVVNINDLANAMKSQAVPGEELTVEIVKTGEGAGQGVGYMPDGTMVVVEGAGDSIGKSIRLTVTNTLQTSAGRMIFGKALDGRAARDGEESANVRDRIAESATHQPKAKQSPPQHTEPSESNDRPTPAASRRNPRRS